jgi:hypothetical protein
LSYIISPPLFAKPQELRPPDDLESKDARLSGHKLYPAPAAGTGFTIFIYTKSAHLPSSKIPQITEDFSIPSNRISNCKLEQSAKACPEPIRLRSG